MTVESTLVPPAANGKDRRIKILEYTLIIISGISIVAIVTLASLVAVLLNEQGIALFSANRTIASSPVGSEPVSAPVSSKSSSAAASQTKTFTTDQGAKVTYSSDWQIYEQKYQDPTELDGSLSIQEKMKSASYYLTNTKKPNDIIAIDTYSDTEDGASLWGIIGLADESSQYLAYSAFGSAYNTLRVVAYSPTKDVETLNELKRIDASVTNATGDRLTNFKYGQ